jgi:hypothetical protein
LFFLSSEKLIEKSRCAKKEKKTSNEPFLLLSFAQEDMRPVKIIDKLFLGDRLTSSDEKLLESHEIVAIVNVGGGQNHFESKFAYFNMHVEDKEEADFVGAGLKTALEFIDEHRKKGGNVLVHCKGCICRSPCVVIAYLAKYQSCTMTKAEGIVWGKRHAIRPRKTFLKAIAEWLADPLTEEEQAPM